MQNWKKCKYHLKNGGILSTKVAVREENDLQTFYLFLLTMSHKK